MSGRRGFLALIGGATVSGLIQHRVTAAPVLVLPPAFLPVAELQAAATAHPRLSVHPTQMHAFLCIKGGLPDDVFRDWMEGGLAMVEGCKPGGSIHRAMQREGRA